MYVSCLCGGIISRLYVGFLIMHWSYQDPVQLAPYVGACRGCIQDEHCEAVVTLPHPFSLKPYQECRTLFVLYSWEILALLPALPPYHDLGLLGCEACMLTLRSSPLSTFNHLWNNPESGQQWVKTCLRLLSTLSVSWTEIPYVKKLTFCETGCSWTVTYSQYLTAKS